MHQFWNQWSPGRCFLDAFFCIRTWHVVCRRCRRMGVGMMLILPHAPAPLCTGRQGLLLYVARLGSSAMRVRSVVPLSFSLSLSLCLWTSLCVISLSHWWMYSAWLLLSPICLHYVTGGPVFRKGRHIDWGSSSRLDRIEKIINKNEDEMRWSRR